VSEKELDPGWLPIHIATPGLWDSMFSKHEKLISNFRPRNSTAPPRMSLVAVRFMKVVKCIFTTESSDRRETREPELDERVPQKKESVISTQRD
jgi:hypothetical protein